MNEVIKELTRLFNEGIQKVTELTIINRECSMRHDANILDLQRRVKELERKLNEAESHTHK